jgi:hypothetical protein
LRRRYPSLIPAPVRHNKATEATDVDELDRNIRLVLRVLLALQGGEPHFVEGRRNRLVFKLLFGDATRAF